MTVGVLTEPPFCTFYDNMDRWHIFGKAKVKHSKQILSFLHSAETRTVLSLVSEQPGFLSSSYEAPTSLMT